MRTAILERILIAAIAGCLGGAAASITTHKADQEQVRYACEEAGNFTIGKEKTLYVCAKALNQR